LLLNDYFRQIQILIDQCAIVQESNLVYEIRSHNRGFIHGELTLMNGNILAVREFVKTTSIVDREMYTYQYMTAENQLIFRYDNTGHHRKLNLSTFPHHKHDGSETNVIASDAPDLAEVLQEIAVHL
jgi:Family of unknown function (DUF6516)